MNTVRLPGSFLIVAASVAFVTAALALAGFVFRVDLASRVLGCAAFALLGAWFLVLRRRAT